MTQLLFRKDHSKALFRSSGVSLFKPQGTDVESPVDYLFPQQRASIDFTSVNVLFCGRRGKGKTMAMAGVAKRHKLAFVRMGLKWRVISNHWLKFADYNSPTLLGEVWEEDPYLATRAEVCIDEVTSAMVSRRAVSRMNVNAGRWVEQVRKYPAEVLATTQFPTEVDHYFTRQTDIFILVEGHFHPLIKSEHPNVRRMYGGIPWSSIDLYVFDLWGQWTGRYDIPKLGWPPPLWRADDVIRIGNLPSFWDDYRSSEMIPTMWGSESYKARVMEQEGWGADEVPLPTDKEQSALEQAAAEYDAKLDSDFAQAKRDGTLPQPSRYMDMAGGPIEKWIQGRLQQTGGDEVSLTHEQIKAFLAVDSTVADQAGLKRYLEASGLDVESLLGGGLSVQIKEPVK